MKRKVTFIILALVPDENAAGGARTAATILLTNRTSVATGHANVPNSWWLRVAGQTPGGGVWR